MNRPKALTGMIMAVAAAGLAGCSSKASEAVGATLQRDGRPDPAALTATGLRGGSAPTQNVSCQLKTDFAERLASCSFKISKGQVVYGPYLPFGPGRYFVDFEVATDGGCPGGPVDFDVVTVANAFKPLAAQTAIVNTPRIERLTINVDRRLGDEAPLEFRTKLSNKGASCILLKSVVVRAQ